MSIIDLGEMSETAKNFLRDFSAYSVAAVIPAILSLAALMIFTRIFSPTAFGRYSIAVALVGVGSTLLFGWIDRSIIRFAPEMDQSELIGTVYTVVLGISVAIMIVAGVGFVLLGSSLGVYQPFYIATVAFIIAQGFFQPLVVLFQATLNSKHVTVFKSINAIVKLLVSVLIAAILLNHITGWIWGSVIAILVTIGVMMLTSDALRTLPTVRKDILVRMTGYGLPMVGWIIGDPLLNQADRLLIGFIRDSASVGIYTSNYSLVDRGLRLALIPMLDAIQPLVINAWEGDNVQEVEQLMQRFTRYFFILSVPPLVLMGALSRPLSTLFLGSQYHSGYVVIPIVGGGVFLWSLANVGQVGLELRERTALMSRGLLAAVVFNIIVNIPLIMTFGYLGAAIGTVLSYGVYVGFVLFSSSGRIQWYLPACTVRNTFLSGTAMAIPPAILYLTGMHSLVYHAIAAGLSPLIYVVVLYLTGEIEPQEIARIRRLV